MQNFNIKSYMNNLNLIDNSKSNINRILNPSIRYYPGKNSATRSFQSSDRERKDDAGKPLQTFVPERKNYAGNENLDESFGTKAAAALSNSENSFDNSSDIKPEIEKYKSTQESGKNNPSQGGNGFTLNLSKDSLLNGFILSEVLGRPKSLRRGRW